MDGPLKWHGGKNYLAKKIVGLMPPRCRNPNKPDPQDRGWLHYVEPYFGGGAVLLANDPEGISEVVNDLNGGLINFWRCLQNDFTFKIFQQFIEAVPFSEEEWEKAESTAEAWDRHALMCGTLQASCATSAAAFFIRCRQSLAGRMKGFTGITKTRTRRGMNNEVSAWLTCVEGLPTVHTRLKRVLILEPQDALGVIRKHAGPRTLFYLDPPYLDTTRASPEVYEHEMTAEQHRMLLHTIRESEGYFMLSGYRSELYDDMLSNQRWHRHDFDLPNNAAGGAKKRRMTECLWVNY